MSLTLSTLAELRALRNGRLLVPRSNFKTPKNFAIDEDESDNFPRVPFNQRLQLILRQIQLNLPVEPFLEADPLLAEQVQEVVNACPQLLHPKRPIQLDYPVTAPITANDERVNLELSFNVGWHQGNPKLFDWAMRSTELTWQDEVKLWAATHHFSCQPEQVKLVILALRSDGAPVADLYSWSREQQEQTETWLRKTIFEPAVFSHREQHNDDQSSLALFDLETIPEIAI